MNILHSAQIIVSALVVALILLQQRGADGLGSAFGSDIGGSAYRTRRGLEKSIFIATIVLAVLFVILAVISVAAR